METDQTPRRNKLLPILLTAVGLYIIFASLGRFHWLADVLATFLDYVLGLLLLLVGMLAWKKRWRFVAVGIVLFCWGAIDLFNISSAPLYPEKTADLRLMVFNVYYENPEVDAVLAEIRLHDPDLIYLMEYPSNANPAMRLDLSDDYPFQLVEPSRFTMGTALYSKYPFVDTEVHQFARTRIPISEAVIEANGRRFVFVGGHPWPPLPQWGGLHGEQLQDVIDVATAVDQSQFPLIVAGDFNTPPQAYMLSQMTQSADVKQVRQRFDFHKTFTLFPFVSIPLDHALVSEGIQVSNYFYGDSAGSDHVPVVVDFSVQP